MVAVKIFLTLTSQLHFQNNGAANISADPFSNSMLVKLKRGGRKGKEIGKGQRRIDGRTARFLQRYVATENSLYSLFAANPASHLRRVALT